MANYSLVIDSKFSPFTYQELLHPVMAATQAHQALETEYGNLESTAELIAGKINEAKDPESYKRYTAYYNALKAKADQLSREGLNTTSRRDMLKLKSDYNKQIMPIATAIDRRKELEKEQRTAIASNPTLRYERMARDMSLDTFVDNPEADYGQSYSGALLMQQVSQAVSSYAKALTKKGKLKSNGLPFQYQQDLQRGATPDQVMQTIIMNSLKGDAEAQNYLNSISDKSDREAIKYLNGVVDQVITSSKIRDWADDKTLQELLSFANQGLYSAVGESMIKDYQDTYGMQVAAERRAEARAARAARTAADNSDSVVPHNRNLVSITGKMDVDKNAKKLQQFEKAGYIKRNKDGSWFITKEGWNAYNRITYSKTIVSIAGSVPSAVTKTTNGYNAAKDKQYKNEGYSASNSEFNQFIRSFGKKNSSENFSRPTGVTNVLNRAYKESGDMQDVYTATELRLAVSGDQATRMSNAILSSKTDSENPKFHVQIFKPGQGWIDGKKSYTAGELAQYYNLVSMNPSKYGITAIYNPIKSDGSSDKQISENSIRIKVDAENTYPAKSKSAVARMGDANIYDQIIRKGYYPKTDPKDPDHILTMRSTGKVQFTDKPLDEAGILKYRNEYHRALNDAQDYTMNIGVSSTIPQDNYQIIYDWGY